MEVKLSKKAISDMGLASKYVRIVDGTYIVHLGCHAQYQDKRKGIVIETTLSSLEDVEEFQCTKTTGKKVNADLTFLTKGKSLDREKNSGIKFVRNNDASYLFSNLHRQVVIDHELVTLRMPTIDQFLATAKRIGVDVTINNIGELSRTGREKCTVLIIRDETFSSILTNSGEHFFKKNTGDNFLKHEPLLLESDNFLKIGRENFKVEIYKDKSSWWLLTIVTPGKGIQCRILEKLKVL